MLGKATRLAVLALLGLTMGAATAGAQQPTVRADVVVDTGDGRVAVRQAVLDEPFTGLDLLQASGLELELAGGAVCRVGPAGCPAGDCFCQCSGGDACRFWHYYHGTPPGGWEQAATGAADAVLADGAVDGWAWSDDRGPITATLATRSGLRGMAWLQTQQSADGSVAGHAGLTAELVLAAASVGVPVADLFVTGEGAGSGSGETAMGYLARVAADYSDVSAAAAGKLAAAVSAGGADPMRFGGVDLVARLRQEYDTDTGAFGSSVWDQSWAMLGLVAAGEEVPFDSVDALLAMAAPGGGWGGAAGSDPDPDSTGLALQALGNSAARESEDEAIAGVIAGGVEYLRVSRNSEGGWGHEGGATNANSTAYAIQGLVAVGEDIDSAAWESPGGTGPREALIAIQLPDGRFEHDTGPADLVATLQAVPAVAGRPAGRPGTGQAGRLAEARIRMLWNLDGGAGGFSPGNTIDAVLALAANGANADPTGPAGATPSAYLKSHAADYAAQGPAAAGKLAMGAVALGEDVRDFGGVDLVAAIDVAFDPASGAYGGGGTWNSSYAILGLVAADAPVPAAAVDYLLSIVTPLGGWGFEAAGAEPDPDSTALALQAARAAGRSPEEPPLRMAVETLHRLQLADGSWPGYDGAPSTVSTAAAITGMIAAGQAPDGAGWRRDIGFLRPVRNEEPLLPRDPGIARLGPADALLSAQFFGGGFLGYGGEEDIAATSAALLALSGRWLPIQAPGPGVYLPFALQR